MHCQPPARVQDAVHKRPAAAKATLTASLSGCQRLARWRQGRKLKTAASSGYPRRCPPRI
eukprot:scaffold53512_cov48-Phaeocystis_antarctica.AAC.1